MIQKQIIQNNSQVDIEWYILPFTVMSSDTE